MRTTRINAKHIADLFPTYTRPTVIIDVGESAPIHITPQNNQPTYEYHLVDIRTRRTLSLNHDDNDGSEFAFRPNQAIVRVGKGCSKETTMQITVREEDLPRIVTNVSDVVKLRLV